MANWMGGRLATATYAALNEAERGRRRAGGSRRRRLMERREREDEGGDRDGAPPSQPRGALMRVIQPIEQQQQQQQQHAKRRRNRRGGEETALMDRLRTADSRPDNTRTDTLRHRDRDRQREDSRERDRGYRGERRRGTQWREEYDRFDDRQYGRRQPRPSRFQIREEMDESWDEKEDRDRGERYGGWRRDRDDDHRNEVSKPHTCTTQQFSHTLSPVAPHRRTQLPFAVVCGCTAVGRR